MASSDDENSSYAPSDEESQGGGEEAGGGGKRKKSDQSSQKKKPRKLSSIDMRLSKIDAFRADSTDQDGEDFGISMSEWEKKKDLSRGSLATWVRDEQFLRWAKSKGHGDFAGSGGVATARLRARFAAETGRKKADAGGTKEGKGGVQGNDAKSGKSNATDDESVVPSKEAARGRGTKEGKGGVQGNDAKSGKSNATDDESVVPSKEAARGRGARLPGEEDGREERLRAIAMSGAEATAVGRYDVAFMRANQCLEEDPDHPMALELRAHAMLNLGLYEEAISDYEKVVRLLGPDPKVSESLERCKSLLEQRYRVSAPRSISPTNADAEEKQDDLAEAQEKAAGVAKELAAKQMAKAREEVGKPKAVEQLAAEELAGKGGREGGQMEDVQMLSHTNEMRIESLETDNAELRDRLALLENFVYSKLGNAV